MKNTSIKGARSELAAVIWLIDQGYHVFRNVTPSGPVDIVAIKDGVVELFDVKTREKSTYEGHSASWVRDNQKGIPGLKLLLHDEQDGSFRIIDLPKLPDPIDCGWCKKPFVPRRREAYCSRMCQRYSYNESRRLATGITRSASAIAREARKKKTLDDSILPR